MTSIVLIGGWAITKQFPAQEEPRHKIVQNKPQKEELYGTNRMKNIFGDASRTHLKKKTNQCLFI